MTTSGKQGRLTVPFDTSVRQVSQELERRSAFIRVGGNCRRRSCGPALRNGGLRLSDSSLGLRGSSLGLRGSGLRLRGSGLRLRGGPGLSDGGPGLSDRRLSHRRFGLSSLRRRRALAWTDSFSLPGGAGATFAIVATLLRNRARASEVRPCASCSFEFRLVSANLDKISPWSIRQNPSILTFCDLRHGLKRENAASQHVAARTGEPPKVAVSCSLGHHEFVVPETELAPKSKKPAIVSPISRWHLALCLYRCARWASRCTTAAPCSGWSRLTRALSFKSRPATAGRPQTARRRHSRFSLAIRVRVRHAWNASPFWSMGSR